MINKTDFSVKDAITSWLKEVGAPEIFLWKRSYERGVSDEILVLDSNVIDEDWWILSSYQSYINIRSDVRISLHDSTFVKLDVSDPDFFAKLNSAFIGALENIFFLRSKKYINTADYEFLSRLKSREKV